MTKLGKIADKVMTLILGEQIAGACVPNAGDFCYCRNHKRFIVSCTGPCEYQGTSC